MATAAEGRKPRPPATQGVTSSQSAIATVNEQGPYTSLLVHHVIFRQTSGLQVKVRWLLGRMYPTKPGRVPSFDDPSSFNIQIMEAMMYIPLRGLSTILNANSDRSAKLKKITVSVRGPEEIEVTGRLHKWLPVQIIGHVDTTPDGRIRIQITKLKAMKMPVKGLLNLMGLNTADLVDGKSEKGIEISDNTILLDMNKLLPPPRNIGKITAVRLTKSGELEEMYGKSQKDVARTTHWRNYLQLNGGAVRFGKLTMNQTDLIMIDTTQDDWFHFDLARYSQQLAEGDMQMTRNSGLQIFLPDVTKLKGTGRPSPDLHWLRDRQGPVTTTTSQ